MRIVNETGRPGAAPKTAAQATTPSPETLAPPADADTWSRPQTTSNVEVLRRPLESAQYTSSAFAQACRRLGINRTTGRTGNALDNACAESFFSTLQHQLINGRAWTTRAQARQEIALWAHTWYNQRRLHSTIAMAPPIEHEQAHTPNPQTQPLHD